MKWIRKHLTWKEIHEFIKILLWGWGRKNFSGFSLIEFTKKFAENTAELSPNSSEFLSEYFTSKRRKFYPEYV